MKNVREVKHMKTPTFFTPKGLMGWSIEAGGLGRVSVRNLWLKRL